MPIPRDRRTFRPSSLAANPLRLSFVYDSVESRGSAGIYLFYSGTPLCVYAQPAVTSADSQ